MARAVLEAPGKANVGISNDKEGEKPSRRKTKGSSINANRIRGESGPKAEPQGAADGHRVKNP